MASLTPITCSLIGFICSLGGRGSPSSPLFCVVNRKLVYTTLQQSFVLVSRVAVLQRISHIKWQLFVTLIKLRSQMLAVMQRGRSKWSKNVRKKAKCQPILQVNQLCQRSVRPWIPEDSPSLLPHHLSTPSLNAPVHSQGNSIDPDFTCYSSKHGGIDARTHPELLNDFILLLMIT